MPAFVKLYFKHANPIGQRFELAEDEGGRIPMQIAGVVRDARYRGIRDPIPPVAYVPFENKPLESATFIIRTSASKPMRLAATLRREVSQVRSEFRVSNIRTQLEINRAQAVRERLLATLALFFAIVALLLASIGLYGVLEVPGRHCPFSHGRGFRDGAGGGAGRPCAGYGLGPPYRVFVS